MAWIKKARAIAGFMSVMVLVALLVADFWFCGRHLSMQTVSILLALIGALLGVDIAREKMPLQISISGNKGKNE